MTRFSSLQIQKKKFTDVNTVRRNTEVTEINKERAPQGAHKKPRPLFMQDAVFDYTYVLKLIV